MLKRIQEIKNVGTFVGARPASIELTNLVYLYGPNSQGKTTLCDIFKSIMLNDSKYVSERKTIGQVGDQLISLNFGNKKEIDYKNGTWEITGTIPELDNIHVFDTDFVHKNVFTNAMIEHQNKENFTKFVIGDESVILSNELQELNIQKHQLDGEISLAEAKLIRQLNGKIDLENFIKIEYKDDVNDEDVACLGILTTINEEKSNIKNIDEIKKLKMPKNPSYININFIENYIKLNKILTSSVKFDKESMLQRFNNHKAQFIQKENLNSFDGWLVQGLALQKDNICPFCGTETKNNNLVESYIELFSNEIKEYNKNIEWVKVFKLCDNINIPNEIYKTESEINKINSKIFDESIQKLFNGIIETRNKLISDIEIANKTLFVVNEEYKNKITDKITNCYKSIEEIQCDTLTNQIETIKSTYNDLNALIEKYGTEAQDYISKLSIEQIEKHICELEKEFNKNNLIVLRNKLDEQIKDITDKKDKVQNIIKQTKLKKDNFDKVQDVYLKEFYDDINFYFNQFGSRNYKIEKVITNRGTNKTYSLDLKFKDAPIPAEKIQFVLSESDRRALALAIFFSKIKKAANENSIIVLDDPITSFDLERMNVFINKLKEFKDKVCQIIITTHYQSFYKKLVSLTYNENPTLIKIKNDITSNSLIKVEEEKESLLMDEYEAKLYEMTTFMKGISHSYSEVSARTVLQKYLEYHFAYELIDQRYDNLSALLNLLKDKNYIDNDLYIQLNNKREEYNDPAHQFEVDSEEQKRNSINELYGILQQV